MLARDINNTFSSFDKGRRLAVIVGVNDTEVQFAEDDALAVESSLKKYARFTIVETLLGEKAKSNNVKSVIRDRLIKERDRSHTLERNEEDFLLFYFAGHGYPLLSSSQLKKIDKVYLGTSDFDASAVEDDSHAHISLEWLRDVLFNKTRAGRVLIILDCCHADDVNSFSGVSHLSSASLHKELHNYIKQSFDVESRQFEDQQGGMRATIAAARFGEYASERNGHGILTSYLLQVLTANVDHPEQLVNIHNEEGPITLWRLYEYLDSQMSKEKQMIVTSITKAKAEECIIAYHPNLFEKIRFQEHEEQHIVNKELNVIERPRNFIIGLSDSKYQLRTGDFEFLEFHLLSSTKNYENGSLHTGLIGIGVVGMGGLGKSRLAYEFARKCERLEYFSDGIFWMSATGKTLDEWRTHFAELADNTEYRPNNDTAIIDQDEKRRTRARYICRYLANHRDVLLILDNVEQPNLVTAAIEQISGQVARCTILYTSRNTSLPKGPGIHLYCLERLAIDTALSLLLERRPIALLRSEDREVAHHIYEYVQGLPLALILLGAHLEDIHVSILELEQQIRAQGVITIAGLEDEECRLAGIFSLSWLQIKDEMSQRVLMLTSYAAEAASVPFWLLEIASGLEGSLSKLTPLGAALSPLRRWSLIEPLEDAVRLHPLIREFVQLYLEDKDDVSILLRKDSSRRLAERFTDIDVLEQLANTYGYWGCLDRVKAARVYAEMLGDAKALASVERYLIRESTQLSTDGGLQKQLKGLFYQQLFNRAIEDGDLSLAFRGSYPTRWIRQIQRVGYEEGVSMRVIRCESEVEDVVFTKNGREIVAISSNGITKASKIYIWDVASGRLLVHFEHIEVVTCLAFDNQQKRIIMGDIEGVCVILDANSGAELKRFGKLSSPITCLALSSNGSRCITGDEDGRVCIWDFEQLELVTLLSQHNSSITGVVFSPDGSKIAIGSRDWSVSLWDAISCSLLGILNGHQGSITGVAFSPEGLKLATSGEDGTVRIWNPKTGKCQVVLHNSKIGEAYTGVALFPESSGTKVIVTADDTAVIWDVETKQVITQLRGHTDQLTRVVFSPEEKALVATASRDGTIRLWNIAQIDSPMPLQSMGKIAELAFLQNGTSAITTSRSRDIQQWDTNDGKLISRFSGIDLSPYAEDIIVRLVCSPDGKQIVTGSLRGIIQITNTNLSPALVNSTFIQCHVNRITCMALSPDSIRLATGSSDGIVYIHDVMAGNRISLFSRHTNSIECIAFSLDGMRIATAGLDGRFYVWDVATGAILASSERLSVMLQCICFSDASSIIITGDVGGTTTFWSTLNGDILSLFSISGYFDSTIAALSISPNGQFLAICYDSGHVAFYDINRLMNSKNNPSGSFTTNFNVKAIYWHDNRSLILADTGGISSHPHFFHLKLEGNW